MIRRMFFHDVSLEEPISPGARKMTTVYHPNMRGLVAAGDQSRMIVFRRELPRSKNVRDGLSIAQDPLEGSPYRSLTPGVKTLQGPSPALSRCGNGREAPADRPDKPG